MAGPAARGGAGPAGDAVRAAGERRRRRPRALRAGGGRGQHGGQVPRLRPGGRRQGLQLQEGEARGEGGKREGGGGSLGPAPPAPSERRARPAGGCPHTRPEGAAAAARALCGVGVEVIFRTGLFVTRCWGRGAVRKV